MFYKLVAVFLRFPYVVCLALTVNLVASAVILHFHNNNNAVNYFIATFLVKLIHEVFDMLFLKSLSFKIL